jgi:multimeric flavodoxin WrbA
MTIRVLGISGSPHRHGNTETLLDQFLNGTRHAGAETEKVVLSTLTYTSCRGCNACHRTGACVVGDDAIPLLEKIAEMDCIAVASPIYSMGITAELKGLIDRAQYLWARKFILKNLSYDNDHMKRHKGVFISTAGQAQENVFEAAFPAIRAFFNGVGFEFFDTIAINNLDAYHGIKNHQEALTMAFERGEHVVAVLGETKK